MFIYLFLHVYAFYILVLTSLENLKTLPEDSHLLNHSPIVSITTNTSTTTNNSTTTNTSYQPKLVAAPPNRQRQRGRVI